MCPVSFVFLQNSFLFSTLSAAPVFFSSWTFHLSPLFSQGIFWTISPHLPHFYLFPCCPMWFPLLVPKNAPQNHRKYQPSHALSVFSPSLNRVSALPSPYTSKGSMFPWPALWLVFGQLEAVHTTWQTQSPSGSCRLDHHLLTLVTAGLLSGKPWVNQQGQFSV